MWISHGNDFPCPDGDVRHLTARHAVADQDPSPAAFLKWSFNPALGIVEAVRGVAERLADQVETQGGQLTVFYFETYGGRIAAASKQYTGEASVSLWPFDVALVPVESLDRAPEDISRWREAGG